MNWLNTKTPSVTNAPWKSKIFVLVDKFKPNVWTRYDWSMFKNLKRYN